ncbi:thymidylate kinase [Kitasatospora sp. NPDC059327]|uniref:thymidylate kinase n=1 Tax=Kitasatospora sp. NPDC059327 TaxID=3346803 RepID=UPI0036942034
MTTAPARRWVTIEGTNAVGKSHLAALTAAAVGPGCTVLAELPDTAPGALPGQVVAALAAGGDPFLRTGHPLTETFALLALAVRRREQPPEAQVVIEDRGCDSVAIYQALTVADALGNDPYPILSRLLDAADRWRVRADVTVLLRDDPAACEARWRRRAGRPLTADEADRLMRAAALYDRLAADDPGRYLVVDRARTTADGALDLLTTACRPTASTVPGDAP